MKRALTALGSLGFLIALGLGPAPAGAQTYDPHPCDACDADNAGPGRGTGFFLENQCSAAQDGTGRIKLTFTNHETQAVEATVNGQMQTVAPGAKATFYVPFSGPQAVVTRSAVRVDGKVIIAEKTRTYPCPCEVVPPTTVPTTPSTSPPSSSPTSPPSTAPATPPGTATPPPSSVPGNFTLPATGGSSEVAVVGGLAVAAGLGLMLVARRRRTA